MYGDVGYRRRYGSRARYYNRYGYAGAFPLQGSFPLRGSFPLNGVGSNAGPVAVGGGYGAPIDMSQLESGYNAHTAHAYSGHYGLFGSKKRKEGEKTPFWSTLGDIGGALVTAAVAIPGVALAPVTGGASLIPAVIVGGQTIGNISKRKQIQQREIEQTGTEEKLVIAREKKKGWRALAEEQAAYIGQGNIGTAASEGVETYYTVGEGPVIQYDPMAGQPGVYVEEEAGTPAWVWGLGGAALAGTIVFALSRRGRR